jgi:hypothetical protein
MANSDELSPLEKIGHKEYATKPNNSNQDQIQNTTLEKYEEVIIEDIKDKDSIYKEEDIDIQVVNELATVEDDTSLPCFTLRVFVTGVVSIY